MIKNGFTGNKGRGGFYKTGPDGLSHTLQLVGHKGENLPPYAPAKKESQELAIKAAAALAQNKEHPTKIIEGN